MNTGKHFYNETPLVYIHLFLVVVVWCGGPCLCSLSVSSEVLYILLALNLLPWVLSSSSALSLSVLGVLHWYLFSSLRSYELRWEPWALVPGHFFIFLFWREFFFLTKNKKKHWFLSVFSLFLSLFLCTHTLGSFEFNQFHQSKSCEGKLKKGVAYKLQEHTRVLTLNRSSRFE